MTRKERLKPKKILERLRSGHFINTIHIKEAVQSTNDLLVSWAREGSCGLGALLAAEEQTRGKGRMGRTWHSVPFQSLTFSFLCPNFFPKKPGWITLGVALASAAAIEKETAIVPGIKWPNDIYVKGRKIAGILAETLKTPTGILVVVGIGLNVNAKPRGVLKKEDAPPVSLKDLTGAAVNRSSFLASILNEIDDTLKRFKRGETAFVVKTLRKRSLIMGAQARFDWKKREYIGLVKDHTDDLDILLQTQGGNVVLPGETSTLVSFQPREA